jgi:hypothetical protein
MLMERRPTISEEAEDTGVSLWEIKRARVLQSVLCTPHAARLDDELSEHFAAFAEDTLAWAESTLPWRDLLGGLRPRPR